MLKNLRKNKHQRSDITLYLSVVFFTILLLSLPSVSTAGGLYINELPSVSVFYLNT